MIDLSEATFAIPFKHSHPDRNRNLNLTINYLLKNFKTNIAILELDSESHFADIWNKNWETKVSYYFEYTNQEEFSRSHSINTLARLCNTKIFVMQDADFVFTPTQIQSAYESILNDNFDFVLPYNNVFMWIPNDEVSRTKEITPNLIKSWRFEKSSDKNEDYFLVGGTVFVNLESFKSIGMMNEKYIGWGFEDVGLYYRAETMGLKIKRIEGIGYHLEHYRDTKQMYKHSHYEKNKKEYEKIKTMNSHELQKYIESWV